MSPRYLFLAGGHVLIHARPNINHAKLRRYKRRKLEKSQVCSKHYHHFPLKHSRLIITPEVQIGHHHRFCIVLQDLTPLNNITSPRRLETTPSSGRRQIMPYQIYKLQIIQILWKSATLHDHHLIFFLVHRNF